MEDRVRKIFVAGGAGYVGTRLCNLLADSGTHEPDYEVTVFDQFWFGDSLDDTHIISGSTSISTYLI